MTWVTGTIVFVLTWWMVLFAVLPWGVHIADRPEPGHATSAPVRPRLLLKFAVTTVIAAIITAGIIGLVESGVISFRGH